MLINWIGNLTTWGGGDLLLVLDFLIMSEISENRVCESIPIPEYSWDL